MFKRSALMYQYDKTFNGFLCCIYSCCRLHEIPSGFCGNEDSLFEKREICTNHKVVTEMRHILRSRLGSNGFSLLSNAFLYGEAHKETDLLMFTLFALRTGPSAVFMRGHPLVARVCDMERAVLNEAHHFLGFIRFTDYGYALSAIIEPKHFVLPKIRTHFCDRFSGETFLIFDKTHKAALLHHSNISRIVPLDAFSPAQPDDTELLFRSLFQRYHTAVSIPERKNERCQNTNLPKRFRGQMTEFSFHPSTTSLSELSVHLLEKEQSS